MGATASLMLMVNNINFKMDSVFSLLIWLTPIVNAVIVGFLANIMDYEDSFAIPVAPFLFFAAAWFCCIYKTNYPDIYDKCVFFETIALIALGVITLLVGVISERKQKKK